MKYVPARQKTSKASLCLGIVGTVFSLIFPLATYGCSIPGLIFGVRDKKRRYRKATAGMVLNIVALAMAAANSILSVVVAIKLKKRRYYS